MSFVTEYIDTHTHIADEAFSGEEDAIVSRARAAGVCIMLQADIDSRERERMFTLTDRYPGVLRPMLGLYPGSVDKNWQQEILELEKWTGRAVVAIGEIGLDYHYGAEFAREQRDAATSDLGCALQMSSQSTSDIFFAAAAAASVAKPSG